MTIKIISTDYMHQPLVAESRPLKPLIDRTELNYVCKDCLIKTTCKKRCPDGRLFGTIKSLYIKSILIHKECPDCKSNCLKRRYNEDEDTFEIKCLECPGSFSIQIERDTEWESEIPIINRVIIKRVSLHSKDMFTNSSVFNKELKSQIRDHFTEINAYYLHCRNELDITKDIKDIFK